MMENIKIWKSSGVYSQNFWRRKIWIFLSIPATSICSIV